MSQCHCVGVFLDQRARIVCAPYVIALVHPACTAGMPSPKAAGHERQERVDSGSGAAAGEGRPTPVCARTEIPGVKRSFATWGKLTVIFN